MTGIRLRRAQIVEREGWKQSDLLFTDRERELRFPERVGEVEEELLGDGWIAESVWGEEGMTLRNFVKRGEALEEGPFRLVCCTNPAVVSARAEDARAAVAVKGEWAAVSTALGDAVVDLFRWDGGAWGFHSRLRSQFHARTGWLSRLAFAGDALLVATPLDGAVLRFELVRGTWKQSKSLSSDLRHFGETLCVSDGLAAVGGWQGKAFVVSLVGLRESPLRGEYRMVLGELDEVAGCALGGDWLALAVGHQQVHLFRKAAGTWEFAQTIAVDGVMAVAVCGERLMVTLQGLARWFRLEKGAWVEEGSLRLPDYRGEQHCVWRDGLVAIGLPDCYGGTGRVVLLEEGSGTWRIGQAIEAPEARVGSRFGASVDLDREHLIVGAQGSMFGSGCGYIYRWERRRG